MDYKFSPKINYEDYASGRVLYGNSGIPNFPVRLINEIFRRCITYKKEQTGLTVYDPCCGGGYLLSVIGLCNQSIIGKLIASDISDEMLKHAGKNLNLLTTQGLNNRISEIDKFINLYNKNSHMDAKKSAIKLQKELKKDIPVTIFKADCLQKSPLNEPIDIIITDIPYGNLVSWNDDTDDKINVMLERMNDIANDSTIIAIVMGKKEKFNNAKWKIVEKEHIGKRKYVILMKT